MRKKAIMMRCIVCENILHKDKFHNDATRCNGKHQSCKDCSNMVSMFRYFMISQTASYKKRRIIASKKWNDNNKEKTSAHSAVNRAVKRGVLIKPVACEDCGSKSKLHAHHDDYSKRLEVKWVCVQCHEAIHHG